MQPDEQMVTGEAVSVELPLAGVGSRGIAALIDIVITFAAQLAVLVVLIATGSGGGITVLQIVLVVTEILIVAGYPIGMETLWRGRTLGKAMMGLRVVRDDGGPIRFRHALVRGLVGVFVDKPGITYALGALIPMVSSRQKKRIGDFFAGTVVLQERVPGQLEAPVGMPPMLAGWAASLDLTGVDDALALRMRQFLSRASSFTPDARATLEHQIASEVVRKVGVPPPATPGWAVIAAVLAERRRRAFAAAPPPVAPAGWASPPLPPTGAFPPGAAPAIRSTGDAEPPPPDGFVVPS